MKSNRRAGVRLRLGSSLQESTHLVALGSLLVLAFALGGGSRADVASLVFLRPLAIMILGFGLCMIKWKDVTAHRYLFWVAGAIFALTLIQLIPLPPVLWTRLPGHDVVIDIDRSVGLAGLWRPISLVPSATWNSLFSLAVPLGVLMLGAQLPAEAKIKLLFLLTAIGFVSAVIAVLQLIGPYDGPLYFYRVTNFGSAVGLFANRNHQAAFLASMFPMLAVIASLPVRREWRTAVHIVTIGIGLFLVPLILVTGSRFGLIGAAIGIASLIFLYRPQDARVDRGGPSRSSHRSAGEVRHSARRKPWHRRALLASIALFGLALGVATIFLNRAEALQRITQSDQSGDFRFAAWGTVLRMVGTYFPFGSGAGSFAAVYQLHEPNDLLDLTYFNHAHNDWLEVLMTGGLPGGVLLAFVSMLFIVRASRIVRRKGSNCTMDELSARLGLVLIVQFAIASLSDYPLRTPALASLFTLAALWAATPLQWRSSRTGG